MRHDSAQCDADSLVLDCAQLAEMILVSFNAVGYLRYSHSYFNSLLECLNVLMETQDSCLLDKKQKRDCQSSGPVHLPGHV